MINKDGYPELKEVIKTFIQETPQGDTHYVCWADVNWRGEDSIASKLVTKSFYIEATEHLKSEEDKARVWREGFEVRRQEKLYVLRNS